MNKVLICGVGRQDGCYLAKLLPDNGYEVWGRSRNTQVYSFSNLSVSEIRNQGKLLSCKN